VIWLNPLALFAVAAVAAPILIHILVQRRAERLSFPTLRFLQPTRLAAIRRHLLADAALLAVRAAILATAVGAVAAPLIVTATRRQAWERRIVRAIVVDSVGADLGRPPGTEQASPLKPEPQPAGPAPYRTQQFTGVSLQDGLRRAVAWLDTAPPARRELVVFSPFAIGAITEADVAALPAGIGIRLERAGTLPPLRTVPGGPILKTFSLRALRLPRLHPDQADPRVRPSSGVRDRVVTLNGPQTIVRETAASGRLSWPVDIVCSPAAQPAVAAAVAAVLSQHVWASAPDRRTRLVIGSDMANGPAVADATPIGQAWMADAVARIARDDDLNAAAVRVAAGVSDPRFMGAPWQTVTSAADGRPLAIAAGSPSRLIVVSAASESDVVTPLLMRSIANAITRSPDLQRAEVVSISDRRLREWARPAGAPVAPRIDVLEQGGEDDRRWFWLTALCLLAIEMWMRRASAAAAPRDSVDREGAARVA
jgi:hypothetical protein